MKNLRRASIFALAAVVLSVQTGCYGSFNLTKSVLKWNGSAGDKVVVQVLFWAMCIIPIYEVASIVDVVFLNLIEFWTGSNPLAMAPGQKEVKIVEKDGQKFQFTATRNNMHVEALSGKNKGKSIDLNYNAVEKTMYMKSAEGTQKLYHLYSENGQELVDLYKPDGSVVTMDARTTDVALVKATLSSTTVAFK